MWTVEQRSHTKHFYAGCWAWKSYPKNKKKIITITLVHLKSTLFLVQFNKSHQEGRFADLIHISSCQQRSFLKFICIHPSWFIITHRIPVSAWDALLVSAPLRPTSSPHMQHVPYSRRWWALSLTWLMFVAPQPPLCRAELVVFQMWAVMRLGPTRCLQCVGPRELLVALLLSARAFFPSRISEGL